MHSYIYIIYTYAYTCINVYLQKIENRKNRKSVSTTGPTGGAHARTKTPRLLRGRSAPAPTLPPQAREARGRPGGRQKRGERKQKKKPQKFSLLNIRYRKYGKLLELIAFIYLLNNKIFVANILETSAYVVGILYVSNGSTALPIVFMFFFSFPYFPTTHLFSCTCFSPLLCIPLF
jgi:hypothetical protein